MSDRCGARAFCRAVAMLYLLALLPFAMVMFVLLPLVGRVAAPGDEAEARLWPMLRWIELANTVPRVAAALERRLCR